MTTALQLSWYNSNSFRIEKLEGTVPNNYKDNYVKGDFRFAEAELGLGTPVRLGTKYAVPFHIYWSHSGLLYGNFVSYNVDEEGKKYLNYREDYIFRGGGNKTGLELTLEFLEKEDQKLYPFIKYDIYDNSKISEYNDGEKYDLDYYLADSWVVGVGYHFK